MGLPGSGKTTLASELVPLLKAKWLNADVHMYVGNESANGDDLKELRKENSRFWNVDAMLE